MWQGRTCLALQLHSKQFQANICCVSLCISWPNLHCQNTSDVTCNGVHKLSPEFSFGLYPKSSREYLCCLGHRDNVAFTGCMGPPTASTKALKIHPPNLHLVSGVGSCCLRSCFSSEVQSFSPEEEGTCCITSTWLFEIEVIMPCAFWLVWVWSLRLAATSLFICFQNSCHSTAGCGKILWCSA